MPFSVLGLGGGMIVNGLLNALVSSVNSRKSIVANAAQQQKNMEFQEALQKKQWRHAEKLQKEMREMTRANFLEQIEHQKQAADLQALQLCWPLPACSPRLIINEFNEYLKAGESIPLQLIIVENGDLGKAPLSVKSQVRNAINELNKFMSMHYGLNSQHSVKVYDTDKNGSNFGAAEVNTIFQVFKVAPTMVLSARVCGSEYLLECWHWGSGVVEKPSMVEVFRCDVETLQLSVLKEIADEWTVIKKTLSIEDADKDKLVDLLNCIENEQTRLIQNGATIEQAREYAFKPYREELMGFISPKASPKYKIGDAAYFINKINAGIERSILSSFKICSSLLSDAHFLLEYKVKPKFLHICADELKSNPAMIAHADRFFESLLNALPEYQSGEKALMQVRMATAYQDANFSDKALIYSLESSKMLESMVDTEKFVYEASDNMMSCLNELKQIQGIVSRVPWVGRQSADNLSFDDMNRHAASLYKSGKVDEAINVWKKAAEKNHVKSAHNLALVLESLNRRDEAFKMFSLAISLGDESFYKKGHELALWYCAMGAWSQAFRMWTRYLESCDSQYVNPASAYSSALLFTNVYRELDYHDCSSWLTAMHVDMTDRIIQQVAEDYLVNQVSECSQPQEVQSCYNVLGWWYVKSKGGNIPFLYGVEHDVDLVYRLPDTLSEEQESFFSACLSKNSRPDIKQYIL